MPKTQAAGLLAVIAAGLLIFPSAGTSAAPTQQRGAVAQDEAGQAMEIPLPETEKQDAPAAPEAPEPQQDPEPPQEPGPAPEPAPQAASRPAPAPKPQSDHLPPPKPDMLAGADRSQAPAATDKVPKAPSVEPAAKPETDDLFARAAPDLPEGRPQQPVACSFDGAEIERVEQPAPDIPACQIPVPVEISALSEPQAIDLKPNATLDCALASAFSGWVRDVVAPAARSYLGSDLKGLRVASSFQCRRRNNLSSGKISEHAKGNAVDVSAFRLADGRIVTVADGWKTKGKEKAFLMHVRKEACDRFLTVLSPEGDAYHQDHMHLDQGCHGKTCIYRICH